MVSAILSSYNVHTWGAGGLIRNAFLDSTQARIAGQVSLGLWEAVANKDTQAQEALKYFKDHDMNRTLKVVLNEEALQLNNPTRNAIELLSEVQAVFGREAKIRTNLTQRTVMAAQQSVYMHLRAVENDKKYEETQVHNTSTIEKERYIRQIQQLSSTYKPVIASIEKSLALRTSIYYTNATRALEDALVEHGLADKNTFKLNLENNEGREAFLEKLNELKSESVLDFFQTLNQAHNLLAGGLTNASPQLFQVGAENQVFILIGLHTLKAQEGPALFLHSPYFKPFLGGENEGGEPGVLNELRTDIQPQRKQMIELWTARLQNADLLKAFDEKGIQGPYGKYSAFEKFAEHDFKIGYRKFKAVVREVEASLLALNILTEEEVLAASELKLVPRKVLLGTLAYLKWEQDERNTRGTLQKVMNSYSQASQKKRFVKELVETKELAMLRAREISPERRGLILLDGRGHPAKKTWYANEVLKAVISELRQRTDKINLLKVGNRTSIEEVTRDLTKGLPPVHLASKTVMGVLDTFVEALSDYQKVINQIEHPKVKSMFQKYFTEFQTERNSISDFIPKYLLADVGPGVHSYDTRLTKYAVRYIKEMYQIVNNAVGLKTFLDNLNAEYKLNLNQYQLNKSGQLIEETIERLIGAGQLDYKILINPWFGDPTGKKKYLTIEQQSHLKLPLIVYFNKLQTHTYSSNKFQQSCSWLEFNQAKKIIERLNDVFVEVALNRRMAERGFSEQSRQKERIAFEPLKWGNGFLYHFALEKLVSSLIKHVEEHADSDGKAPLLRTLLKDEVFLKSFVERNYVSEEKT